MTEVLIVLAAIAVLIGLSMYLLVRGANAPELPPPPAATVPPPVGQWLGPLPPTAKPEPRVGAPARITIKMVSAKGRWLGTTTIEARHRRATFQYRTGGDQALSNFTADHRESGSVWVYRRIGVEREK